MWVCLCVCVGGCVYVCVCVCEHECMCVYVFVCVYTGYECFYTLGVLVCVCKAWANRKVLRQDLNQCIHPTGFGRQSHVRIAPFALQCALATAVQSSSVSRASTATSCTACTAVRITTAPACAIPPSSLSTVDHRCNWSPTPLKG